MQSSYMHYVDGNPLVCVGGGTNFSISLVTVCDLPKDLFDLPQIPHITSHLGNSINRLFLYTNYLLFIRLLIVSQCVFLCHTIAYYIKYIIAHSQHVIASIINRLFTQLLYYILLVVLFAPIM